MFFFKRNKIIVDAFVTDKRYINLSPIEQASKHWPEWFKNASNNYVDSKIKQTTLKQCNGILDLYKNSFIMPLWTDFNINAQNGQLSYYAADQITSITPHPEEQWKIYADPQQYKHIKIDSPWLLKTKEAINWVVQKPFWNFKLQEPFIIPEGILNFKYQSGTNINMFINMEKNFETILKFNSPILQLIPLTEKEVEFKYHEVSIDEWIKYKLPKFSFSLNYNKYKKLIDDQESKKKCPFGFGGK
jgi:hypothetical protein